MKKIKLILTDVDGCLTDGSVYYGPNHEKYKKFNMQDGMALKLLHENNILAGIITSVSTLSPYLNTFPNAFIFPASPPSSTVRALTAPKFCRSPRWPPQRPGSPDKFQNLHVPCAPQNCGWSWIPLSRPPRGFPCVLPGTVRRSAC